MEKNKRPREFWHKAIILGTQIDDRPMDWVLRKTETFLQSEKSHKIFTPNPEICLKAEKDENYRHILNQADINIPDGFGLQFGAKILGEKLKNRVTGADLTAELLKIYKHKKIFVVLREDSLTKPAELKTMFKTKFPKVKFEFALLDHKKYRQDTIVLNKINKFKPDILFVCLGAPAQEIWIHENLPALPNVRIALGVGGSFDFLSGKMSRAPKVMRDLGLEWSYRLIQEPKRLARIKNAVADFLLKCHEWKKRMSKVMRPNVLGIIINSGGEVLLQKNARLTEHWQFPQGGIELNEKPEQAVIRECAEELGVPERTLKVMKKLPLVNKYEWPPYAKLLKGYKGQEQQIFVLKFTGNDKDFHIKNSIEVEDVKWVDKKNVPEIIHPVRKSFATKAMKYL